jgi:hypothetical protein
MPALEGDAKVTYELIHHDDSLWMYENTEDLGHGGKIIDRKKFSEVCSATGVNSLKGHFFHQPTSGKSLLVGSAMPTQWILWLLLYHPIASQTAV